MLTIEICVLSIEKNEKKKDKKRIKKEEEKVSKIELKMRRITVGKQIVGPRTSNHLVFVIDC